MAKTNSVSKIKEVKSIEERRKNLEAAIAEIEKSYGAGSVMKLDEINQNVQVDIIPTDCLPIDLALGIGGFPRGRVVEIYGPESSGKTTLTLQIIAQAQKQDLICGFIDAEHALDVDYAKKLGVNLSDLYVSQPGSGEEALDILSTLVKSGSFGVIVVDSVAALTPAAELSGDMGQVTVGLQARLMSQALRKLTPSIAQSNTLVLFINQLRDKVNTTPYGGGPSETTTGGKALKFFSSVRVEIRKIEGLKRTVAGQQEVYGNATKIKVVKNKLAPPFKTAQFDIIFGKGISKESSLIDLAVEAGVMKKSGSFYSYNSEKLGQGKPNTIQFLEDNKEVYNSIYQEVLEKLIGSNQEEKDIITESEE